MHYASRLVGFDVSTDVCANDVGSDVVDVNPILNAVSFTALLISVCPLFHDGSRIVRELGSVWNMKPCFKHSTSPRVHFVFVGAKILKTMNWGTQFSRYTSINFYICSLRPSFIRCISPHHCSPSFPCNELVAPSFLQYSSCQIRYFLM